MPRLEKGTKCVKILLSQVSKDMHAPMLPMLFSVLEAHISEAKRLYPDLTWKEMNGILGKIPR